MIGQPMMHVTNQCLLLLGLSDSKIGIVERAIYSVTTSVPMFRSRILQDPALSIHYIINGTERAVCSFFLQR